MSKAPRVLIDASYLAHRALHSLQGLEFEDFPTGVIYGLLEQILSLAYDDRITSNRLLMCFDSRKSYRKKAYPDYKGNRNKDRTEKEMAELRAMHKQVDLMRSEVFPACGFLTARQSGVESDDLMAYAAKQGRDKVILVTSDGDLYQCITDSVHWYDPGRDQYLDPLTFWVKKGIEPHQWAEVQAIAGCSSDNVKGIRGIAEKSAIDYVLGRHNPTYKRFKAVVEGRRTITLNRSLVTLPHKKTKPFDIVEPQYNPAAFFEQCERFGIRTYLEGAKHSAWLRFFSGDFDRVKSRTRKRGR